MAARLDDRLLSRCVDALCADTPLEAPTVLVIDDDEVHAGALVRWLSRRGFVVDVRQNHSEGIRDAIAGQWDAVLLDGADAARITDARPDVAVLMVTAAHVEGALVKPYDPGVLLEWLRAATG